MYKKPIKILAIESSCDETAAAIIGESDCHSEFISESQRSRNEFGMTAPVIFSNIVSSQIDLHAKTGGVVPEVASRAHMEAILPVIKEVLSTSVCHSQLTQQSHPELAEGSVSVSESPNNSTIQQFNNELSSITHIAVTAGPGLIGSLLVGFNTAKALAYSLDIPVIPINHIEGHIYSAFSGENPKSEIRNPKNNLAIQQFSNEPKFPILALTVSGGHTSLTLMKDHGVYENIGATLDDAAGEAFDKVAKLLNLGYPGGPVVSKLAQEYRKRTSDLGLRTQGNDLKPKTSGLEPAPIVFPRPILNDGTFNFSFSGLKTAVLTYVKKATDNGKQLTDNDKAEICCAFEDAVVDVLVTKTLRAAEKYNPKAVILAGGVAANNRLREELSSQLEAFNESIHFTCHPERSEGSALDSSVPQNNIEFLVPPINLCGDNAAMIGVAAYYHILKNDIKTWNEISVGSNFKL